jgi:protein-S-isoprenylcysteine O-methyltransferase Ste14
MKQKIKLRLKSYVVLFFMYIIHCCLYFVPAGIIPVGTFPGKIFEMPVPWIYFLLQIINAVVVSSLLDPDLMKERMTKNPGAKGWDILFNKMYAVSYLLMFILAGLDVGVVKATPVLPLLVKIPLLSLLLIGAVFADWAVLVNRFYSRFVRIQTDRGHHVVNKGPYKIIRHPAYLVSLITLLSLPILLNSLLAYIPGLICFTLMVWRTYKEDKTLKKELRGYLDYSKEVKYRLIPGIF